MTELAGDPVVVALPGEIDGRNSETICAQLCSAVDEAASIVVVDMTPTTLCDSAGFRMLLVVSDRATENGVQLRLAASAGGPVLGALALMGFDRVLRIYPSLHEALVTGTHNEPQAATLMATDKDDVNVASGE
jgi:anti-sigma B factor antagonist